MIMAGLFKRVYDWLLRLFWSVPTVVLMTGASILSDHSAAKRCTKLHEYDLVWWM